MFLESSVIITANVPEIYTPRKFVSSLREKEFVADLDGLNELLSVLTKYRLIFLHCYTL